MKNRVSNSRSHVGRASSHWHEYQHWLKTLEMSASYLHSALPASEAPAAGTSMFDVVCTMSLSSPS